MTSPNTRQPKRVQQEESMSRVKEEAEELEYDHDEDSVEARLIRVVEQLDGLSLQIQDFMQTVKETVTANVQGSIQHMNTRLKSFFAYQVAFNQQLAKTTNPDIEFSTFLLPPPPPHKQGLWH